jgi:hypothetical protein
MLISLSLPEVALVAGLRCSTMVAAEVALVDIEHPQGLLGAGHQQRPHYL